MKIWQLTPTNEEPAFQYISSEEEAYYYVNLFNNKFYTTKTILEDFRPTLVFNLKEADIGRLLFTEQEFWVFTEKAKQALEPLFIGKIEFLPLITRKKSNKKISRTQQTIFRKAYKPLIEMIHPEPHYLINILDIKPLEVIDFDKSEFEFDEEKQEIFMTDSLAFHPEKLVNAHLFKIMNHGRSLQMATFVSDEFRKIVEKNNLTGLKFSELPEDEGGNLVWSSPS